MIILQGIFLIFYKLLKLQKKYRYKERSIDSCKQIWPNLLYIISFWYFDILSFTYTFIQNWDTSVSSPLLYISFTLKGKHIQDTRLCWFLTSLCLCCKFMNIVLIDWLIIWFLVSNASHSYIGYINNIIHITMTCCLQCLKCFDSTIKVVWHLCYVLFS